MSGWIKVGLEFIKALAGQGKSSSHPNAPSETVDTMAEEEPVADSVVVRPESHQIDITSEASPNKQEIERRRETVRQFFNDFWMFRAEDHINERLAACGERWRLDAATRKQLGLPN